MGTDRGICAGRGHPEPFIRAPEERSLDALMLHKCCTRGGGTGRTSTERAGRPFTWNPCYDWDPRISAVLDGPGRTR